ncbi:unnamed protein product [Prorocentrum cordatum]|uniref:Uncharacterized protein n=1 Tax=Prorocentrum cordatum TaxID=2364126 RepID=A0ABN9SZI4_9DINO|nr:unnamed protein product [Polarella glacialis]
MPRAWRTPWCWRLEPPARSGSASTWVADYGNAGGYGDCGGWAGGVQCFLPTGYCGKATSLDGISWTPVDGSNADKSVFAPGDRDAWDGLHVGVGDVVRLSNGTLARWRTWEVRVSPSRWGHRRGRVSACASAARSATTVG